MRVAWQRLLLVLLASFDARRRVGVDGFRIFNESDDSEPYFVPHERGFVGRMGEPRTLSRDRVNEGAQTTNAFPQQQEPVHARQNCPGMVGPLGDGKFYCLGKEYGYCDRRSGTCFCNMGYQGVDCGSCRASHYRSGSLCYPRSLCPNDCTGHGICNFEDGTCSCNSGYWGEDCSKLNCERFDPLCLKCNSYQCMQCMEGYSVVTTPNGTTQYRYELGETDEGNYNQTYNATIYESSCRSCTRFDPRCSACNDQKCLECADPLLNSVRRSGYRSTDANLAVDEFERQLSVALPFGTQDFRFFDDAEVSVHWFRHALSYLLTTA